MGYIGVDLHTNRFTATYRTNEEVKWTGTYQLDLIGIEKFRSRLSRQDVLAVEACGNTRYFVQIS